MDTTTIPERLRQAIDVWHTRLRREIPSDREAAIVAIIRAQDRLPYPTASDPVPDLVTGQRVANLGENMALSLLLEPADDRSPTSTDQSSDAFQGWASRFLRTCGELAEAGLVLGHA